MDYSDTDTDIFFDASGAGIGDNLHEICEEGDMMELYKLPLGKININVRNSHGMTPLGTALRHNNYNCALELMKHGATIDPVDLALARDGFTRAIESGSTHDIMAFLRAGMSPNQAIDGPRTYMTLGYETSCRFSSTEVLSVLIGHGGDVNALTQEGKTLLFDATDRREWSIVELLVKHGANMRESSGLRQRTIFHVLCMTRGTIGVMKSLLKRVVNYTQPLIDLHWSNSFFQDMPYLEAEDSYGETALMQACESGQAEQLEILLRYGANPNTPDRWNLTPLLSAIFTSERLQFSISGESKMKIISILLKHNANCDLAGCVRLGENGPYEAVTPVELAVRTGQLLVAQILHHITGSSIYNLPVHAIQWLDGCGYVLDSQKREMLQWLRYAQQRPQTLLTRCRHIIRKHISRPFAINLETLHLPTALKNYLALSDMDTFESEIKNGQLIFISDESYDIETM